ncbi:MAG TPA: PilW family protein [Burkholderiales bacterium]|nr:PilW family protein [Burkholderiales bacterium]
MFHSKGFSMVEIMVGMVIGLLGVIIIMQIFALAEGQKRTTTSGADAQTNGNIALYTIEREARQSGYGINLAGLGCSINTSFNGSVATPGPLVLSPVVITDGGVNASGYALPDTLRILFSMNAMTGLPQTLAYPNLNGDTQSTIGSTFTVAPNDLMVYYESGRNCTLAQVTAVASNTVFNHGGASPWNTSAIFPASGYDVNANVFDLGSMAHHTYSIDTVNNNLQLTAVSSNGIATYLEAGEIVNLQVQYGKDTGVHAGHIAGDDIVDAWDTLTPSVLPPAGAGTTAQWQQIIAIRIAILARSGQREKPDPVSGNCTATTVAPTWSGTNPPADVGMWLPPDNGPGSGPGGSLPHCYRYKVFETIVPLRNIIWGA